MKFVRVLGKIFLGLLVFLIVLFIILFKPVEDTPYTGSKEYQQTQQNLLKVDQQLAAQRKDTARATAIRVGWAKKNITPTKATPLAGYGTRRGKVSTGIRDSLWVRAFVFDNGVTKTALIASDLLITPPTVVAAVKAHWPTNLGFSADQIYYGAIHSHNSEGGWQTGVASELIAGSYDAQVVEELAKQIIAAIVSANQTAGPAEVGYGQVYQPDMISNRLVGSDGTIDAFVRLLKFKKQTGETALLVTYAAHATLINDENMVVSRDYPGVLVDSLERQSVNFAAFMAGAVGSMGPQVEGKDDDEELRNEALGVQLEIQRLLPSIQTKSVSQLEFVSVPVALREPQLQLFKGWKTRKWVWDILFGMAEADVKALRIGNTVLLGMPCDFSGELVKDFSDLAIQKQRNVIITSFNGYYIGYATPDVYWTRDTYESVAMNWFGPNTGSYLVDTGRKLLSKL